ncbi:MULTISPECIES: tetratricopeptide repeat protein [unclassified Halomonas]|uniref:tetratricopeptide repeat protein n=1 Tax=unclassified Halomonas TaxID=2609666 RepID=UPI000990443C|nr:MULTISPECIES: tetratricopeptide repeat protein [unclassified Halomonas]AQU81428.1 hypothetical protein B2G49_01670 [Halomonas sp. 'Soap Lake \
MRSNLLTTLVGLTLATLLSPSAFALNEEAQAAKEEGMRLYGIRRADTAIPYLEQAAEAGDAEAMYYLGEANRRLVMGNMNQAALDWYYQAAQHGEPYAMLRLFDGGACELGDVCPENGDDWPQEALELTLPKAEAGDAEAMAALYHIYYYVEVPDEDEAMAWLHRAAEAGNVNAMNWLGELARNDERGYANDTERLEAAEVWFRKAAEAGYALSMNNLAATLSNLERHKEAWQWMTKASEAGHINGRGWLAACNIDPNGQDMYLCHSSPAPDPAKGWAILLAIHEEVPGSSSENALRAFRDNVTPEQRAAGEGMKDEWLNLEPPLSYFPEKFGY